MAETQRTRHTDGDGEPPRRHRRWITLVVVVAFVITGGTWTLAGQARTPRQLAADAAPPPKSTIAVPVRFETLVRSAHLSCEAELGMLVPVPIAKTDGESDAIITKLPIKQGQPIVEGKVVVEVSGRPIIAISGRLPAYRDLVPEATGPDVRQLQKALMRLGLLARGAPSGTFDQATQEAITRLYRERGYPAPAAPSTPDLPPSSPPAAEQSAPPSTSVTVPRGELVALPRLPARLGILKARVGGVAKSGGVVIASGDPVLKCSAPDPGAIEGLRQKATVHVRTPRGRELRGRVARVSTSTGAGPSEGNSDDPSQEPNQESSAEVIVHMTQPVQTGEGYQAQIEVEKAEKAGPVVPASALWSRPGGRTVLRVLRGERTLEVPVEPGFEVDGHLLVHPVEGELQRGDRVVVTAQPEQDGEGSGS